MITVKLIDKAHAADINLKNEPFSLYGRLIPSYTGEVWGYQTELFAPGDVSEMCFPDENYDYDAFSREGFFLGAYDGGTCVGLAVLQRAMFRYMYLYDLKVKKAYRGQHVGALLVEKMKELALEQGYRGIYTQGQDNNLAACLFYLKSGFVIGGLDTRVYTGTAQEGKSDVIFYCDAEAPGAGPGKEPRTAAC